MLSAIQSSLRAISEKNMESRLKKLFAFITVRVDDLMLMAWLYCFLFGMALPLR